MSNFRDRTVAGTRLVGTFAAIPHPVAIEVTAQAGPDFICIDWEHAQIARDQIENLVRACDVHGCRPWCGCPAMRPRRSPRRSTAARAAFWCRASRRPRRRPPW